MKTTTEMKLVPVAKLVPYVNNARTHSPEQINKLRSSLREFGFINPVIIDRDYGVIAGHGRILAAKEEGITEVPCVFADHLTEAQKKAYIIADNRMAMDAGWDEELLRVEIEALQAADFDPLLTGFDEKELSKLFDDGIDAQEDDFDVDAELQKPTFSKSGDVWTLGRHRLVCGDSTKEETYATLMVGRKANLVITDPPYNVNYEGSAGKIKNDNMDGEKFYQFLFDAFSCMEKSMADDASIYVFHRSEYVHFMIWKAVSVTAVWTCPLPRILRRLCWYSRRRMRTINTSFYRTSGYRRTTSTCVCAEIMSLTMCGSGRVSCKPPRVMLFITAILRSLSKVWANGLISVKSPLTVGALYRWCRTLRAWASRWFLSVRALRICPHPRRN